MFFCVHFFRYQKLSQTSEVILKGRHLDEALSNLNFVEDESVTEESLKYAIAKILHLIYFFQYCCCFFKLHSVL
jgi:hypothetical protein